MSTDTVTLACSLPQGLVLEVGLEIDYNSCQFVKTPQYRRVVLKGRYYESRLALPPGVQITSQRALPPALTEGVPRDLYEEWARTHPKMVRYVWPVEARKDLAHQVGDRPEAPLQPLDPTKKMKLGGDVIEPATFAEPR